MTFGQYKTIIDAYLNFYPDANIDVQIGNVYLRHALDDSAEGKTISQEVLNIIDNATHDMLDIIIYYPSLTLTNDYGKQYTVYGIYVNVSFPSFGISMGRTVYNRNEISVGYRHSHIERGEYRYFSRFCTGSADTPINRIRTRYNNRNYNDFTTFIQSFIIEVERMIRIESNEGGPYITFSNIGKSSVPRPLKLALVSNYYISDMRTEGLFKKFIDYYCSLHMDRFYYDGRCYQLAATDAEFIERVTKAAKTWRSTKNANIYQNVNIIHGLYYNPTGHSDYSVEDGEEVSWMFKGKHPKIQISNGNNIDIKSDTIVKIPYISKLYTFLLDLVNGIYANYDKYKDCIYTRAYKVKTALIKEL